VGCHCLTAQNLWDAVKGMPIEKFIAIQAYLKKQERHQINNLTLHLKPLQKEKNPQSLVEKRNHKVQRRNE